MALKYSNLDRRAEAEQKAFGRSLDDAVYARLVGLDAPTGDITVQFLRPWPQSDDPPPVTLRRRDEVATLVLRFFPGWVDLSTIIVHAPGQGTGRRLLRKVFAVLKEWGAGQVRCVGRHVSATESSRGAYGHYVMPRFGFDGSLPETVRSQLPQQFEGCNTISELLTTEAGRQYWRQNGVTLWDLAFDLSDHSASWETLKCR